MPVSRRALHLLASVIVLAGCNDSDDLAGPGEGDATPPVIERFLISSPPSTQLPLLHGERATLRWNAPGATLGTILPGGVIENPETGSLSVRPAVTTTYRLLVSNSAGSASDTLTVEVRYPPGIYVDGQGGDDSRDGTTPATALKTLGEALNRLPAGGAISLSGGQRPFGQVYTSAVDVDGPPLTLYGGLDPETFFESDGEYLTIIAPPGERPLSCRNTTPGEAARISDVIFRAVGGIDVAAEIENSTVFLNSCMLDGREAADGIGLRITGASEVELHACRVFGGRVGSWPETYGVRTDDASSVLLSNCFVDGGRAEDRSIGIEARGILRLGFNTIGAEYTGGSGLDRYAAAVCIRSAHPALGGNILFCQGTGRRIGVLEEVPGSDPSWLEGNLFVALSQPPYVNDDGSGPGNEVELNDPRYTTGNENVGENRLVEGVSTTSLFVDPARQDFHLKPVIPGGDPNPAVDAGGTYLGKAEYGGVRPDIDGERRPVSGGALDLGADEL